jgi:Fe-S-cluster containining protein
LRFCKIYSVEPAKFDNFPLSFVGMKLAIFAIIVVQDYSKGEFADICDRCSAA